MAVSIELNELSDPEIQKRVESVIRGCIGDRPREDDWKVWIHASAGHCQVVVKGPTQKRERFFFEDHHVLGEKIRDWLEAYPLR